MKKIEKMVRRLIRVGNIRRISMLVFAIIIFGVIAFQTHLQYRLYQTNLLMHKMNKECSSLEMYHLLEEIKKFPVYKKNTTKGFYCYENGYGQNRTYGGKRKHQGIDIISNKNKIGYCDIQSVTDGKIEQIGWLPLGGYRIGIRSKNGFYYYYAHLASYACGMKKGKQVHAGDILGYMGNTGYGKEGTKGKFVVHLHFGIYHQVRGKEKSINPYYLLKILEQGY